MTAHILVVDDDPPISELLRRALAFAGYSVTLASRGGEALTRRLERSPDLIVLDVMLPDMDGFEVVRRLRAAGATVPVLLLTARDAVEDRVEGLAVGADDYLVKPFDPRELLARVNALLRRSPPEGEQMVHFAALELDTRTRLARRGMRVIELLPSEYGLLALFMRHPRQVLTRDVIFAHIWGDNFEGSSNVLEVTVGRLRKKLEAGGEPRLIHTVRGVGYVLRE